MALSEKVGSLSIIVRADASSCIGTGHVMRCLALSKLLRNDGHCVHFVCREFSGNIIDLIESEGFSVTALPYSSSAESHGGGVRSGHEGWLQVDWNRDASETKAILDNEKPDWLIVDHYGIDYRWEESVSVGGEKILVIDDLADRRHTCDILLDQNLGRSDNHYKALIPSYSERCLGPGYAVLRPEFRARRDRIMSNRIETDALTRILVSMGGVDQLDATSMILECLKAVKLRGKPKVDVVMGGGAPYIERVREVASSMPYPTSVSVGVRDMHDRMACADLAIGAAGSTAYERCCLGLPTMVVVLAKNQEYIAERLEESGASITLPSMNDAGFSKRFKQVLACLDKNPTKLRTLSQNAAALVAGDGAEKVTRKMYEVSTR